MLNQYFEPIRESNKQSIKAVTNQRKTGPLHCNHPEAIIKYFVTNLNEQTQHQVRASRFLKQRAFYIITIKKLQQRINNKAKLKEMPSSGSCITYKILNSLQAPRDSSFLRARLKYMYSTSSNVLAQYRRTRN